MSKKYFEARDTIQDSVQFENKKKIIKLIDDKILFHKILYIFSLPLLIIVKIFVFIKNLLI